MWKASKSFASGPSFYPIKEVKAILVLIFKLLFSKTHLLSSPKVAEALVLLFISLLRKQFDECVEPEQVKWLTMWWKLGVAGGLVVSVDLKTKWLLQTADYAESLLHSLSSLCQNCTVICILEFPEPNVVKHASIKTVFQVNSILCHKETLVIANRNKLKGLMQEHSFKSL